MPRVAGPGVAVGQVRGSDAVLAAGAIDAVCEQMVAGANRDGDVLVLCGTTLIVWATIPEWREVAGLWTIPHTAAGKCQIGGASNAGGLFLNWVDRLVGRVIRRPSIPAGYRCGRRTCAASARPTTIRTVGRCSTDSISRTTPRRCAAPPTKRPASLCASSSSWVARRWPASWRPAGEPASSHGCRAIADATGHPVEVSGVPEGAALGAAFLGRMAAGLESSISRCGAVGVDRTHRRAGPGLAEPDGGPLRAVPRAGRVRTCRNPDRRSLRAAEVGSLRAYRRECIQGCADIHSPGRNLAHRVSDR